jgi:hypothetical protein
MVISMPVDASNGEFPVRQAAGGDPRKVGETHQKDILTSLGGLEEP